MGDNIKIDVSKRSSGQVQLQGCFKYDNEFSGYIISGNFSSR